MMEQILKSAKDLAFEVDGLSFSDPVHTVYNPLGYAWGAHEAYLRMWPERPATFFMGMNPGPWGMAQTGAPFGEVGITTGPETSPERFVSKAFGMKILLIDLRPLWQDHKQDSEMEFQMKMKRTKSSNPTSKE
ncbi:MAG: hypothetical protein JJU29_16560 [Verrucomicrobia bacterium]|nr:hypothetical protein [Verrucomicrobiota bacterium]MCH8513676.1 hypothetical protein [Kiritimatiellia bacterium]